MVATGEAEALAGWLHEASACSGFLVHPVERVATLPSVFQSETPRCHFVCEGNLPPVEATIIKISLQPW